jgi:hypothetical protein
MGFRALNVVAGQPLLKTDRGSEFFDKFIGRLSKPPTPEFFRHFCSAKTTLKL